MTFAIGEVVRIVGPSGLGNWHGFRCVVARQQVTEDVYLRPLTDRPDGAIDRRAPFYWPCECLILDSIVIEEDPF